MSEAFRPVLCPDGHDDTVKLAVRGPVRRRPVRPGRAPLAVAAAAARAAAADPAPRVPHPERYYAKLPPLRVPGALVDGADLTLRVPPARTDAPAAATHVRPGPALGH